MILLSPLWPEPMTMRHCGLESCLCIMNNIIWEQHYWDTRHFSEHEYHRLEGTLASLNDTMKSAVTRRLTIPIWPKSTTRIWISRTSGHNQFYTQHKLALLGNSRWWLPHYPREQQFLIHYHGVRLEHQLDPLHDSVVSSVWSCLEYIAIPSASSISSGPLAR